MLGRIIYSKVKYNNQFHEPYIQKGGLDLRNRNKMLQQWNSPNKIYLTELNYHIILPK